MEKQGVVVHYFLGLDAQPPLSAVQVFSLQHIRPMVAGETVKKIICHARVGDQGYPCIVLAVDHASISNRNINAFATHTAGNEEPDSLRAFCGPSETVKTRPRKKIGTKQDTSSEDSGGSSPPLAPVGSQYSCS